MTVRKLNYTNRQPINSEHFVVTLEDSSNENASFSAEINLDNYQLQSNGLIFIEAYWQTIIQRFDCGTVENPCLPDNQKIDPLLDQNEVQFRLRVTEPETSCVLAQMDDIKDSTKGTKDSIKGNKIDSSLLSVRPADLDNLCCKIDFGDKPKLQINNRLPNWPAIITSTQFLVYVYPTALNNILGRILFVEKYRDTDDEGNWRAQWLKFVHNNLQMKQPIPDLTNTEDIDYWIDEAVRHFCSKTELIRKAIKQMADGNIDD